MSDWPTERRYPARAEHMVGEVMRALAAAFALAAQAVAAIARALIGSVPAASPAQGDGAPAAECHGLRAAAVPQAPHREGGAGFVRRLLDAIAGFLAGWQAPADLPREKGVDPRAVVQSIDDLLAKSPGEHEPVAGATGPAGGWDGAAILGLLDSLAGPPLPGEVPGARAGIGVEEVAATMERLLALCDDPAWVERIERRRFDEARRKGLHGLRWEERHLAPGTVEHLLAVSAPGRRRALAFRRNLRGRPPWRGTLEADVRAAEAILGIGRQRRIDPVTGRPPREVSVRRFPIGRALRLPWGGGRRARAGRAQRCRRRVPRVRGAAECGAATREIPTRLSGLRRHRMPHGSRPAPGAAHGGAPQRRRKLARAAPEPRCLAPP